MTKPQLKVSAFIYILILISKNETHLRYVFINPKENYPTTQTYFKIMKKFQP